MKKLMIPVALILMGTGAAFATKAAKGNAAITPTYRIDQNSGLCVAENQTCSTVENTVCKWSGDGVTPMHAAPISPTECGAVLFKP